MIVSASRRTDLPAFHARWFLDRLDNGFVDVANPFNTAQVSRVDLRPEAVDALVFWTRLPSRTMLEALPMLERNYRSVWMVTITGMGRNMEPGLPGLDEQAARFRELARALGPERVIWRFDPVIAVQGHLERPLELFRRVAEELRGHTLRVIVSLLDPGRYKRAVKRTRAALDERGVTAPLLDLAAPEHAVKLARLADGLAGLAREHHLEIQSCASPVDLAPHGIPSGACIDPALLNRLFGLTLPETPDPGQRTHCNCAPSKDIGSYNTCSFGCRYCYATR
jgi:hypothetical protein